MYHFSKCRFRSLALLRHLVIFSFSRFSLFLYLFLFRNLIKSHFPTSPSPSNLNVKLTMAFRSYLSFPLVRMLLTSHSFRKGPPPLLNSRPLKSPGLLPHVPTSAGPQYHQTICGLYSCSQATDIHGRKDHTTVEGDGITN